MDRRPVRLYPEAGKSSSSSKTASSRAARLKAASAASAKVTATATAAGAFRAATRTTYTTKPTVVIAAPSTPAGTVDDGSSGLEAAVWISLLVLFVVVPLMYLYTVGVVATRFPSLRNKRVCLLIAHPDDEAMFFAPTVLALARPETGNHVKILCLSSGDAAGLGETRKKELVKSAMTLGLRREDDVFVLDSPDFPDSMTAQWSPAAIATLLCEAFAPHLSSPSKATKSTAPTASIDVLITFDRRGVSGHPNHVACHLGARAFSAALLRGKEGFASPVDVYSLRSVGFVRKYSGVLDVVATLLDWGMGGLGSALGAGGGGPGGKGAAAKGGKKDHPPGLVFMNGVVGGGQGGKVTSMDGQAAAAGAAAGGGSHGPTILTAWKAMVTAHKSQMVWFRWGWILFSRYMYMNDLRLEKAGAKVK